MNTTAKFPAVLRTLESEHGRTIRNLARGEALATSGAPSWKPVRSLISCRELIGQRRIKGVRARATAARVLQSAIESARLALGADRKIKRDERIYRDSLFFSGRAGTPFGTLSWHAGYNRRCTTTPADRLQSRRESEIRCAVRSCLRDYARAEMPDIYLSPVASDWACSLAKTEGWVKYSRRYGSRPGITSAQYTVTAQASCPLPREIGGMVTLGAIRAPALERPGEEIYRATWARQAQDGPETLTGYILAVPHCNACAGYADLAHGRTLGAARGTLSRRGTLREFDAQAAKVWAALRARDLNGYDVTVRIGDSLRAGNCKDGTLAFRDKHFPGRDTALVSELLAVPAGALSELVLGACVAAIRRHA